MSDVWWLDPLKLVDEDDLYGAKADDVPYIAEAFFRDRLVDRPPEYAVLLRMLRRAMSHVPEELTARQRDAVRIAWMAANAGLSPIVMVADELDISFKSARKLLKRADARLEMAFLAEKSTDICVDTHVSWQPMEVQIRQQMSAMRKRCAGGVDGCKLEIPGRYDLCPVCMRYFGSFSEWPGWLVLEVRRIRQEHRRAAIAALYEVRSLDEVDE